MPFKNYQSVYTPEELANLTEVLNEAVGVIARDRKEEIELDHLKRMLATVIIESYKAGEIDTERLKAIVLIRAKEFGFLR
jgi:hypothetical protein